jgi:hypothetical protein
MSTLRFPMSQSPALTAIAFQLVAALERYQASVDELLESWLDRSRWKAAVRQLDEIRKLRCALPQLAVDMMELAMRQADLLQTLWAKARVHPRAVIAGEIAALRSRHCAAIDGMRQKCLKLLARDS